MRFSMRTLSSVFAATLILSTGCASEADVVGPASTPTAVSPTAVTQATATQEPIRASPEVLPAPTSAPEPTVAVVTPTPEPQSAAGLETVGDEEGIQRLISIELPPVRAMGGNLRPGDNILLFANIGDTLDRSSIALLGEFELRDVNRVIDGVTDADVDDGEELRRLSDGNILLTFDPGFEDLTGLDAAVANDFVLVMALGRALFTMVNLPADRALAGEIAFGDMPTLARLDGTVLMDFVEVLEVRIDGVPLVWGEADEYDVTFKLSSGELLDTALAILADDIQLIAG